MGSRRPPNDRGPASGKRLRKRNLFDLAGRVRFRPDSDYRDMRRLRDATDSSGRQDP